MKKDWLLILADVVIALGTIGAAGMIYFMITFKG